MSVFVDLIEQDKSAEHRCTWASLNIYTYKLQNKVLRMNSANKISSCETNFKRFGTKHTLIFSILKSVEVIGK